MNRTEIQEIKRLAVEHSRKTLEISSAKKKLEELEARKATLMRAIVAIAKNIVFP